MTKFVQINRNEKYILLWTSYFDDKNWGLTYDNISLIGPNV